MIHARPARRNPFDRRHYQGVTTVLETQLDKSASDSDDDIPVARLLRPRQKTTLTNQQIADCKMGPIGERAIGETVAKKLESVEFRGVIDKLRERGRFIYHVKYTSTDGDEEELSQKELRDCFVLALAPQIEAEWVIYNHLMKGETSGDKSDSSDRAD